MKRNPYLRAGRLEDVLFLLQYLGLSNHYSLEKGTNPDGTVARSVCDGQWVTVGREHPEFFRITPEDSVVLSMRYYQAGENGNRPPMRVELVQHLVQNALALHEQQAKRAEVWKTWGTFIAALVAAVSALAQLLVGPK